MEKCNDPRMMAIMFAYSRLSAKQKKTTSPEKMFAERYGNESREEFNTRVEGYAESFFGA